MNEQPLLQLLYLKEDGNQSVEVEEVKQLDLAKIMHRLNHGESVFISLKCKSKEELPLKTRCARFAHASPS